MNRLLIILIAIILPVICLAQHPKPEFSQATMLTKYANKQGYTTIEITKDMLVLLGAMNLEAKPELMEILNNISSIRIVISDQNRDSFTSDIALVTSNPALKLMTMINESGQDTRFFYMGGEKGIGSEFIMTSTGKKDNLIISITGKIDLKNISSLAGLNIGGMNNLGKISRKVK